MNKRISIVMTATAGLAGLSASWAQADSSNAGLPVCEARLLAAPTEYPESRRAIEGGTVLLNVVVGRDARVTAAHVHTSSGSPQLDRAAQRSALSGWKFLLAGCQETQLPLGAKVAVQYQQRPAQTFSALRHPAHRKLLQSALANGCEVTHDADGDFVASCIVANGAAAARMAGR